MFVCYTHEFERWWQKQLNTSPCSAWLTANEETIKPMCAQSWLAGRELVAATQLQRQPVMGKRPSLF